MSGLDECNENNYNLVYFVLYSYHYYYISITISCTTTTSNSITIMFLLFILNSYGRLEAYSI